jgi:disulfide bond formation protein DsbB
MGLTALGLELLAWGVFQKIQGYEACELCVYIRFSMILFFIASLFALINPRSLVLRLITYSISLYSLVKGWIWDIRLEQQHIMLEKIEQGMDFFAAGGALEACSTEPRFPFGLPLHEWFPSNFQPTGVCGADGWLMLGFNMSECLFLFYGAYTLLGLLFFAATVKYKILRKIACYQ